MSFEIDPPSEALLAQLDADPKFRAMLLRHELERSALGARQAQEYVQAVLAWRKRNEVEG